MCVLIVFVVFVRKLNVVLVLLVIYWVMVCSFVNCGWWIVMLLSSIVWCLLFVSDCVIVWVVGDVVMFVSVLGSVMLCSCVMVVVMLVSLLSYVDGVVMMCCVVGISELLLVVCRKCSFVLFFVVWCRCDVNSGWLWCRNDLMMNVVFMFDRLVIGMLSYGVFWIGVEKFCWCRWKLMFGVFSLLVSCFMRNSFLVVLCVFVSIVSVFVLWFVVMFFRFFVMYLSVVC